MLAAMFMSLMFGQIALVLGMPLLIGYLMYKLLYFFLFSLSAETGGLLLAFALVVYTFPEGSTTG